MNLHRVAYALACLISAMSTTAACNGWNDAGSMAMAGSYTAVARGCEAIGFNPANIGLSDQTELQMQLFAFGSTLNNNSFSMSDYEAYNGTYLSDSDKRDILSKIPAEGLEFAGNAAVSALSFAYGAFAVSTTLEAAGKGSITRDVVDLAFYGNRIGETVSVDNSRAEGIAHVDLNFAYGRTIRHCRWGKISAGINLKYIHGLGYFEAGNSTGQAITEADGIDADGSITIRSATGGNGFGLDVGAAAIYHDDWAFSLGIKNIFSSIRWSTNARETQYTLDVISLTAENADQDSTVVSDEIERQLGAFSNSLGPQINLGASRTVGRFLLASDLKLGLTERAGLSTTPEISVGAEFRRLDFLPLRAGVSIGGARGTSLALGGGITMSAFYIDLAWASTGTFVPSWGRGMSVAVSSGLRF